MTLYEITNELVRAYESLEIDEETGEILNYDQLDKLKMDFDEKAENVALMIKNLSAEAEAIKVEKTALANRQKATENKAEGLKNYLDQMMKAANKTELKRPKVALSFRKSKSLELDLTRLSPEWLKQYDPEKEESYRKTDITKAIKEGQIIDGATLVEKQNLQIK